MSRSLRFSIGDMLLATLLAALPLAFARSTGWVSACTLSLMSLALTLGYGQLAIALMCISLLSAAIFSGPELAVGAVTISVVLTVVIALVLRYCPKRIL